MMETRWEVFKVEVEIPQPADELELLYWWGNGESLSHTKAFYFLRGRVLPGFSFHLYPPASYSPSTPETNPPEWTVWLYSDQDVDMSRDATPEEVERVCEAVRKARQDLGPIKMPKKGLIRAQKFTGGGEVVNSIESDDPDEVVEFITENGDISTSLALHLGREIERIWREIK